MWPDLINGHVTTRVIQTLLNVGFFDAIQQNGSVSPRKFAAANDLDVEILSSLCDSLYASALLDKDGEGYRLTPTGDLIVNTGRGWFNGIYGYEDLYRQLESMLRKEKHYGRDVHRMTDFVARGSGEIESALYFPLAIDIIEKKQYAHVLDLGCGDGTFLRHACQALPSIAGYGVDMAVDAIGDASRLTKNAKLSDRLQFLARDVTKIDAMPDELRKVDVATTFFLLHEILYNGPEAVVVFLKAFRRLFPNVPLIVFEVDRPSPSLMRKRHDGMSIPYFLHHDLSHQKPVARHEWHPLFEAAGFAHIEERNLSYARSVIFSVS